VASGRPDFHPTMLLEGKYGTELIPVLVDALGQLFMIVTGIFAGSPKTLSLDENGRILAHLIGYDSVGAVYRTVGLDPEGNLNALMKGMDGANLRTVAVDGTGIIKANLAVQDLNYLKFRPVYGSVDFELASSVNCLNNTDTTLLLITGKGAILGGRAYLDAGVLASAQSYDLKIDGVSTTKVSIESLYGLNAIQNPTYPLYCALYNPVTDNYKIGIGQGISFEESFAIEVKQSSGGAVLGYANVFYALVP